MFFSKKLNDELLMERERRMNVEQQNQAISANLQRLHAAAEESFEIQNILQDKLESKDETITSLQVELDSIRVVRNFYLPSYPKIWL